MLFFMLIAFVACTTTSSSITSNSINTEGYVELTVDSEYKNYEGKKVYFKAKICKMEMQHMLRRSFNGNDNYVCIDMVDSKGEAVSQMLAYTDMKVDNEETFTVFGTLGSVSGAGKGGGMHTEYYLELEKVE